mmetsp:Transcript_57164/g.158216  ORF Transcript_57164/g.158216 Transcript_57164/m.158216 type:complete len:236 (+) Transcript_57164:253-960(+)
MARSWRGRAPAHAATRGPPRLSHARPGERPTSPLPGLRRGVERWLPGPAPLERPRCFRARAPRTSKRQSSNGASPPHGEASAPIVGSRPCDDIQLPGKLEVGNGGATEFGVGAERVPERRDQREQMPQAVRDVAQLELHGIDIRLNRAERLLTRRRRRKPLLVALIVGIVAARRCGVVAAGILLAKQRRRSALLLAHLLQQHSHHDVDQDDRAKQLVGREVHPCREVQEQVWPMQ